MLYYLFCLTFEMNRTHGPFSSGMKKEASWGSGNLSGVGLYSTVCDSWCPGPYTAGSSPASFIKPHSCQMLPHAPNLTTCWAELTPRAAVDTKEINYTNALFKQRSYANGVIVETLLVLSASALPLMKSSLVMDALMWIICWIFQSHN